MQIPKIIHLIEPSNEIFHLWKELLPDWECYEWTLVQCAHFIQKFYPTFINTFLSYKNDTQRTRAAWIFLLHRYGGVAIDRNMIPKKRISSLFYTPHSFYVIEKRLVASPPNTRHLDDWIEHLSHVHAGLWSKINGTYTDKTSWLDTYELSIKVLPERIWSNYFIYYENVSFIKILGWKPIALCILACIISYFVFRKKSLKEDDVSSLDKSIPPKLIPNSPSVSPRPTVITEPLTEQSIHKYLGKTYKAIEYGSQYHDDPICDALSDISFSSVSDTLSMSRISSLTSLHSMPDEITIPVHYTPQSIICLED